MHSETQNDVAEASKAAVEKEDAYEVVTEILDAGSFLPAGADDQNYSLKHPVRYMFYRMNCGHDARLHEVWAK